MKSPILHLILILGIISTFPSPGIAQEQTYDSTNTKNLRAEFDSCVVTARKYWVKGDQRQALKHALGALDIAVKSDSIYDDLMALRMVGQVYSGLGVIDSAEYYLNEVLTIADTIVHPDVMKSYNILGNICIHRGSYDKALRYHFSGLELAKVLEPNFIHVLLHNIGFTYYKLRDFERSIAYSGQALQLKNEMNETSGVEDNMINLGLAHSYLEQYDKADHYIDSAVAYCNKTFCDLDFWAHANLARGIVCYNKGDYQEAIPFLRESLRIGEETTNIRFRLDATEVLSKILLTTRKLEEARILLLQGVEIIQADASAAPDASDIYLRLSKVYALTGDYEAAFKYQELSEKVMEGVYMSQLVIGLMRTEGARIEREYKQRLEDRDRLLTLQAGMVSKQRTLNIVLGIAAVLTAALAFVLWRGLLRKKRIAQMLDRVVQSRTREIIERVRLASRA